MKRVLKWVALVLALVLAVPVTALVVTFAGNPEMKDGEQLGRARLVKDGYVAAFVVDIGPGQVALVDCGNDPKAVAIEGELRRRGLGPDAVQAIFVTHGHPDHVGGCGRFSKAQVMGFAGDVPLLEGRAERRSPIMKVMGNRKSDVRLQRALNDGEVVTVGEVKVEAFAVPGHTPGSAAYLIDGVLFMGDSADATKDGEVAGAKWLFSDSADENRASLKALVGRLAGRADEVKTLAFAHTGTLSGFGALQRSVGR